MAKSLEFDVIVVGSGIAGSAMALCLQAAGISTLVIERKSHPRFAIGEATGPTTTQGFRYLAATYDVPELAFGSDYIQLHQAGCTAWPKQHVWFGIHKEGQELAPEDELQAETLRLPIGPDAHLLRADIDSYLVSLFEKYGVSYREHTELLDMHVDEAGARLELRGPEGPFEARARYVVDASGHASFFAKRFGLRHEETPLVTDTRSIFGHFKNIAPLDDALGGPHDSFRFKRSAGTMHHCFEGGWIWVIQLRDDQVSVGATLNRRRYPFDPSIPAEEELRSIFRRFPSVNAHLGAAEPLRPLVKTDRIQFTSKSILGDRFIMTPHAAGFVDPIFSSGINLSLAFIARTVPAIAAALKDDDFSQERFRPVEEAFNKETDQVDRMASGTVAAFGHPEAFRQYLRLWLYAEVTQLSMRIVGDASRCEGATLLYAAGDEPVAALLRDMHAEIMAPDVDLAAFAARARGRLDEELPYTTWIMRSLGRGPAPVVVSDPSEYSAWLARIVETTPEFADAGQARLDAWSNGQRERAFTYLDGYRANPGGQNRLREAIDKVSSLKTPWFAELTKNFGAAPGVEELLGK